MVSKSELTPKIYFDMYKYMFGIMVGVIWNLHRSQSRAWVSAKSSAKSNFQFMGVSIICRGMNIIVGM